MQAALVFAIATAGFTTYPGFGDTVTGVQPATPQQGREIETLVDRGPIVEMIIRCGAGTAIISYSKIEKLYCAPNQICDPALDKTVTATCGK